MTDRVYTAEDNYNVNAGLDIVFATMMDNPIIIEDCRKNGGKSGGLYCRVPHAGGPPSYVRWLGTVPDAERQQYWNNALKKCLGLSERPGAMRSGDPGVRNPKRKIWGGGIHGIEDDHALSGLTENGDEVFSIYAALQQDDILKEDALRLMQSNPLGRRIIATGGLRFGGVM